MVRRYPDISPGALALGLAVLPLSPAVQPVPLAAQAVVQPAPDPAAADLRVALQQLASNPEDLSALLTAGYATLDLGDVDAAEGFFARAQDVAPEDPAVTIGLALVSLRREDAVTALNRFAQAEAAGGNLAPWAGERGLAYDLVGASDRAQALYKRALSREDDPEIVRRLALSHAISGDGEASEEALLPLLQSRDAAAFRTRAFVLAILGRDEEAVSIARTMLPERVANRLVPYLLNMPRLTPAQQAAAANLGVFPDTRRMGRDDPALAAAARAEPLQPRARTRPQQPGSRLVPQGEALGQRPAVERPIDRANDPLAPPPVAARPEPEPAPAPAPAATSARPSFADAFEVYGPADTPATAAAPARSAPAPAARPEPVRPAHPARYWVQLGIGRNLSAFPFDWRKRVRAADGLLDDMEPYRGPARGTNRLLTGPFESAEKAQEMVSILKAAGVDALRYRSAEGEEIVPLD